MTLDLRTLSFSISLISLSATLIMVLVAILVKQYRAPIYWAVGNGLAALGFILLIFRGQIPDIFSIVAANLLNAVAIIFIYVGILSFTTGDVRIPPYFWFIFLLLPPFIYFSRIENSLLYRSVISAIFGVILLLLNGFTLLFQSPKNLKFSYWFAGSGFMLFGLLQLLRSISLFYVNTSSGIFAGNWLQSANFISVFIFMILWSMGSVFMVTQRLSVELTQTARIDFLTQTLNRRAAQERLNQESKRAERKGSVFSIILMDVDKFKFINDHYGHSAGDATLIQISDLTRKNLRVEDMHCRWGGDEFLIMLQDTAEVGAYEVAERLREALQKQKIIYQKKKISCSLSIGVACFGITAKNLEEVITQADVALYMAKSKGGDCIVVEKPEKDQLALL